jgi:hypothetical protein
MKTNLTTPTKLKAQSSKLKRSSKLQAPAGARWDWKDGIWTLAHGISFELCPLSLELREACPEVPHG